MIYTTIFPMRYITLILACLAFSWTVPSKAQSYGSMNDFGNDTGMSDTQDRSNRNFNKHNNDTTQNKEIPKGLFVWTIDRKFGDVKPAKPDTMQHLFMNTIFNTGKYGQYNTTGNNYTPRINRIAIDRPLTEQFIFTQPYSHVMKQPDQLLFTNTLSPITNITYDNCGDKTNGEDHIDALFATNVNKRFGFGFDLNYSYARGYYANQSTSHFGATFFSSYNGDRYKMHAMFSTYHQKASENGGITDDSYITTPEQFKDQFTGSEIPTILTSNWNRNDNQHLFLTHRYSVGFYRKVKMTDEEIKARKFAAESKKENDQKKREEESADKNNNGNKADENGRRREKSRRQEEATAPKGRPTNARIAGDEPATDKGGATADTTRIKVDSQEKMDSLLVAKAVADSIEATMKKEYVPVTSFIHTLEINNHRRIYQAYQSPADYYAAKYYDMNADNAFAGDSIYDKTHMLQMRNTLGIAMLEGFNKWAKAGLKVFASHELRKFQMPDIVKDGELEQTVMGRWSEHSVSVGGQLVKSLGKTLHYNLTAETWLLGEDAGQLKVDFATDLNFKLFGDTVTLGAKAHFYRLNPTFYQRHFHAKHLWWDNDLSKETRTHIEGLFTYRKTNTRLRVAIEEIQNYTYFGVSYASTTAGRTGLTASVNQCGSNINLMTAQLMQDFKLGPLRWENVVTYQHSSQQDALPVPDLNIFTNLYLKFKIAGELAVDLGADAYYFTKYYAPDYCPQIMQFAVQQNEDSGVKIGGYPFVDVYANMHLKHTRFFVMMSHINCGGGSRNYFLAPHYPTNGKVLRVGLSWNFFN